MYHKGSLSANHSTALVASLRDDSNAVGNVNWLGTGWPEPGVSDEKENKKSFYN